MTTEDDFQTALDANPTDWQTRLVFADWLQDRGDPRAAGYRLLGQLRVHPILIQMESGEDEPPGQWFHILGSAANDRARPRWELCLVPEVLFEKLTRRAQRNKNSYWRYYDTRREADDDAARAFAKLPAARRADLLALPPVEPTPPARRARKPKT